MIYKNFKGKTVDTSLEEILCPWCHKVILNEDIEEGNVYHDGVDNPHTGEQWTELMHKNCAERADEWRRDKYGF